MLSTNHSSFLEAVAVKQNHLTFAQNLLSDHPICTQLCACVLLYLTEYNSQNNAVH